MTLRLKLSLAALPALLTLAALGWYAVHVIERLGERMEVTLRENYRSIQAARTLRDVIDEAERVVLSESPGPGEASALEAQLVSFNQALDTQRSNVTEDGEAAATRRLELACASWTKAIREATVMPPGPARVERFMRDAHVRAQEVRVEARLIAKLNQDALHAKSRDTMALGAKLRRQLVVVSLFALGALLVVGLIVAGRVSRPVVELTTAVRRLGEGDLDHPLPEVTGRDEVSTLIGEVRRMAEALRSYRRSSLGELLAAQQVAQAAIDSLRDPVISFGPDRRVRQVNDAAVDLGIDPAIAEPLGSLPAELRAAIERARDGVLSGHGPITPEGLDHAVSVVIGGAARHAQVHATPTASSSVGVGIVGATVLVRDVTSLHAAAAVKDDLLSTVAHELRTPLTSVRMAIYICLEQIVGPLTARQQEVLVSAREDLERLHALVEGILAVSRLEGGGLVARREPVAIAELVEAAVAPARAAAIDRRVELVCETSPADAVCDVDRESAALALGNLVQNAIRHTPEGGRVELVARLGGPGWVRFAVRDTGAGIPAEHRPRLFSRFYRVPGSPRGGTGLGLSIARDIVHAHGGEIGVECAIGAGSTFWLTLPLVDETGGAS